MAFKIYKKNNYIIIEDTIAGKQYQGLAKNVFVYKDTIAETTYDFEGLTYNGLKGIAFNDLRDETNTPFINEQAFIDFYTLNTGNFNSGGATPQAYAILNVTQSGTDAPIVTEVLNTYNISFNSNYNGNGSYSIVLSDGDLLNNDFVLFTDNNLLENNSVLVKKTSVTKELENAQIQIRTQIIDLTLPLLTGVLTNEILNATLHIFRK